MSRYELDGKQFVLRDYDRLPAFSSFLPGLAGIRGVPLWVFYTNRGQAINSFGIHHKGNAIMEFSPANTAFENTSIKGFRTFLRKDGVYFEPFGGYSATAERLMRIEKNRVQIQEKEKGLSIRVTYYVLPEEAVGALVRRVEIKNESNVTCTLEGLDGIPKIIPYGIQNGQYKEMSNLFKSWADVKNVENNAPMYAMRASSDDSAEVLEIKGGYFYFSVCDSSLTPVICDAEAIFGYDCSLVMPVIFREGGLAGVEEQKQCFANKVPCGFTAFQTQLVPGQSYSHSSYIGYAGTIDQLNAAAKSFCAAGFSESKEVRAEEIAEELVSDAATHTSNGVFDSYIEQCYLDNFLRGGYPYVFKRDNKKSVLHLFSRKHGDPERDYNFFSIAGEHYSQGNGNFRDVCQNRRSDVFFQPEIEDFNVYSFFSLIQMDGYNPLEIRPCTFRIKEGSEVAAARLIEEQASGDVKPLEQLIQKDFTPGMLCRAVAEGALAVRDEEALVEGLLALSDEQLEAGFGEGYWSDHWDYLMDLIHNYLSVFPEKKKELLLGRKDYRFYDSGRSVRPRRESYCLSGSSVRQYGSLRDDSESRAGFVPNGTNWVKGADGTYVETTLLGKLVTLALNKFLLLDREGMGIEMEGGKPGWNDAMNGLPGLMGSGMPETLELFKLLEFLEGSFFDGTLEGELLLTSELAELASELSSLLAKRDALGAVGYWNEAADLRERFREQIAGGVSGRETVVLAETLRALTADCLRVLRQGIEAAWALGNGILPTYFTYEATEFEPRLDAEGKPFITPYGLPGAVVKQAVCHVVTPFLEGPARMLSCVTGQAERKREMVTNIRNSDIYDEKLKMYKTSGSIEALSMEHGRVRAFTPGWLERESVFLHMEYKYLLGLLQSGLTEEFYWAMKDALIPFLSPERYGRSTLENSSFIASSVNPDEKQHGRGFVARLSGSTTEMLSMWIAMFLGDGGFFAEDGRLGFRLRPRLAEWLFDEQGKASFTLLSHCKLTYRNMTGRPSYGENGCSVTHMTLRYFDGRLETLCGDTLDDMRARALRAGQIRALEAMLAID